jgi:hypothetical protein
MPLSQPEATELLVITEDRMASWGTAGQVAFLASGRMCCPKCMAPSEECQGHGAKVDPEETRRLDERMSATIALCRAREEAQAAASRAIYEERRALRARGRAKAAQVKP